MKLLTISNIATPKFASYLLIFLSSGLGLSGLASAQYPTQMQVYQSKCSQGDEYSCIQLQQMYMRNNQWRNRIDEKYDEEREDQEEINRINRVEACRSSSYSFDDSHCDYIP